MDICKVGGVGWSQYYYYARLARFCYIDIPPHTLHMYTHMHMHTPQIHTHQCYTMSVGTGVATGASPPQIHTPIPTPKICTQHTHHTQSHITLNHTSHSITHRTQSHTSHSITNHTQSQRKSQYHSIRCMQSGRPSSGCVVGILVFPLSLQCCNIIALS